MAKKVKISNLSIPLPPTNLTVNFQQVVENVINYLDSHLKAVLPDKPDLIVLPENCDRPQSLKQEEWLDFFCTRGEQVLNFFKEKAIENNSYIAYSSTIKDNEGFWRNATTIIDRTGEITGVYYKNHLTIGENAEHNIAYGTEAPLIKCDFGTVACAICFDLNFTKLLERYAIQRPDLIVFSSAYHGGLMQAYWAYTCRAYFVGALRGIPGSIVSPVGVTIATTSNYRFYVTKTVNLDCCVAHLDYNGRKFLAIKEKYGPKVDIFIPEYLGSALITSNLENITAKDIVKEFNIELLDDYFSRAIKHRHKKIK
ncbi:carbon-nitrogen hydrolase family protein [bacterium]|nr:carbon-nitrogen hydrolase family protein [bacterium]